MQPVTRPASSSVVSERGAVMVFVAVLLPVLALFVSLAIDFAHFFDYSRNLQNRADAAALAAGVEYGSKCFGTTVSQTQLDAIGHAAQQYSGPPNGTPNANLPYPFTDVTNYQNQPNLSAGAPADLHLILNGSTSWDKGGTSFSAGTVCAANYPVPAPLSPPQPATDVWITQAQLPLFFPLLGIKPDISAHARVQLQAAGTPYSTIPIAVPDPADVPCLYARVLDQTTGTVVANIKLDLAQNSSPPTWSAVTGPLAVGTHQLSIQAFLPDDCTAPNGPGTLYDDTAQGGGIVFINTYTPLPATVAATTRGTVWLSPGGCSDATEGSTQDPYFYYFTKSTSCSVTIHADVAFPAGQGNAHVLAFMDGDRQNPVDLSNTAGTNEWTGNFAFGPRSGRHVFTIGWYQSQSANNGCKNRADVTKANSSCLFNGGNPLQQSFAAVDDGSDPPDDSGPVIVGQIGCVTGSGCPTIGGTGTDGATAGVNSIPAGTNPNLAITFKLQGLKNSGQFDPPIILRASVQSSKKTGLLDCGQGSGASKSSAAITNGCPHALTIYDGSTCVMTPSPDPWSCVHINTGNERNQILNGFTNRIGNSCNNWASFKATGQNNIDALTDKRAFVMVITSPNDLSNGTTNPNAIVHVLNFAVFYVTGYDGDQWINKDNPNCTSPTNRDEPYPGSGTDKFQIWGHFFATVTGGTGSGNPCNPANFGACVAALTR